LALVNRASSSGGFKVTLSIRDLLVLRHTLHDRFLQVRDHQALIRLVVHAGTTATACSFAIQLARRAVHFELEKKL